MNGLTRVKGKDLRIVVRKWGPAGPQNPGALNHTMPGTWQRGRESSAQHPSVLPYFVVGHCGP